MNQKRFGHNLHILRIHHHLSQKELAAATGLSVSHISHLENGRTAVSMESFLRLCTALSESPNELLKGCLPFKEMPSKSFTD